MCSLRSHGSAAARKVCSPPGQLNTAAKQALSNQNYTIVVAKHTQAGASSVYMEAAVLHLIGLPSPPPFCRSNTLPQSPRMLAWL
jgi:hypothetical protein